MDHYKQLDGEVVNHKDNFATPPSQSKKLIQPPLPQTATSKQKIHNHYSKLGGGGEEEEKKEYEEEAPYGGAYR